MTRDEWRRVWTAYEAACDLPSSSRAAYLASVLPAGELREKATDLLSADDSGAPRSEAETGQRTERESVPSRIGQSIGRFQVMAHLGRGGMGDVYRAFDPELARHVAIKFIAVRELSGAHRVADPIREARAASALNHPGVVTVFEVIRADDALAIVMELVEGRPLRALAGTAHAAADVALWGERIAEALAATHAAGILHRDIKPENLILRPDGYLKILDFGLAAERASEAGGPPVGTLRYMSPEQARGDSILTPATDIFSLGVVLYELAAGVHPFAPGGRDNTTISVAAAAATAPVVPPSAIVPSLPRAFDALIVSMLDKDPAKRPSAESVAGALRSLPNPRERRRRVLAGLTLAASVLLAAYGTHVVGSRPPEPVEVHPTLLTGSPGRETSPSFSPDGRSVVYAWDGAHGDIRNIWIKRLDSPDPRRLTSSPDDEWDPCWFPDGSAIAFLRADPDRFEVATVPVSGGPERVITSITNGQSWMDHRLACGPAAGQLVISDGPPTRPALWLLSVSTRERRLLSDDPETGADYWPRLSPDGRRIAFARAGSGFQVRVMDISGGASRLLVKVGSLKGLAWSADAKSVFYQLDSDAQNIWELPVAGGPPRRPPFLIEANAGEIAIGPDGRQLLYSLGTRDVNLWRIFAGGRASEELAPSTRLDRDGAWSPDGSKFAFASDRAGPSEIWTASANGSNARRLTYLNGQCGSPIWSPDGRWIAFDFSSADAVRIGVVPAGGGTPRLLTPAGPVNLVPSWSRDGKWIYYCSRGTGGYDIWKMPSAGGAGVRVTNRGGFESRESADGRFLYYSKMDAEGIWRLPVSGEGVEEKVADLDEKTQFRCWDLGREGIYRAAPGRKPQLELLPFTGNRRAIGELPGELPRYGRCLSVDPAGQSVLFPVREADRWEIYIADNPARK